MSGIERCELRDVIVSVLLVVVCLAALAGMGAAQVNQEPDVPKAPGRCAIYHTHRHANGDSWQLTCSDPVPDSITLQLRAR